MDILVHPPGIVTWPGHRVRCALGRGGIGNDKHEGDGRTPQGIFPLRQVMYRPDRIERPRTALPVRAIETDDGWCDDPQSPLYNTLVSLPCKASHETLWRKDNAYDLLIVVGYNDETPVKGRGSAIFIHIAGENYKDTEGCVALNMKDLETLVGDCDGQTRLITKARSPASL